jgi:hypothetical protein
MAKRVRGSARPGQRRPNQRAARPAPNQLSSKPSAPAPSSPQDDGLTPEEEARAAELEASMVADDAAPPSAARATESGPTARTAAAARGRGATAASLATRYAHEYDYVARDLREIFALMGILIVALFAIFFLVVVVLQA